ncbi:Proteasome assembly chaperone 1 [Blattella germanica]|nr:Proteasome assembly chaperone 1 [Blattella germanica]
MATYFGEIVEKSSRAFWDDDFDSEDEMELERNEKPVGQLELVQSSSSGTIKCKLFFVIHGPLTEGFAEAYLINKGECVAEIKETDSENEDNTSGKKRKKPTTIYRISDEVLLCICSPYVDITNAFEFTEKV